LLRSQGKGQDERKQNQTRIHKPVPSLVSGRRSFACHAARLFYTSQGTGCVSGFPMKLSFKKEKKGKEQGIVDS